MTEWTLNTSPSPLAKGMLVRRPGLDEALEVVKVTGTDFKIKLPGGKTATLPLGAEVEWSWPEPEQQSIPRDRPEEEVIAINSASERHWDTDWSLLDVGVKIEVLGEKGDFTILRLSDSSARIKDNATGQIMPLTIGHKFKILDTDKGKATTAKESESKPAKDKSKSKSKAGKKSTPKPAELPLNEPESDLDSDPDSYEETEATPETEIMLDNEPSDEDLAAIENGDDSDDDEEIANRLADGEFDADDDTNDDDTDYESIQPFDNDDFKEDDNMPATAPAPKSAKPSRSASTSRSTSTSLLTVGQISDRTGISYPTLMRYIRDHADRLPSEGEGRSRRFLPESIEVFKQIRSETKGGRPSKGGSKPANPSNPTAPRKMPSKPVTAKPRVERSHETAAPYAAPARSKAHAVSAQPSPPSLLSSNTIDQALAQAIDHARAQMDGLQSLIDNLEAQRESLKLWS